MADLICRWRNPSVSQVLEFNNVLPRQLFECKKGREYTNANWNMLAHTDFFTTPYQLAAQLGLYYEDETHMYPRFNNLITVKEAWDYMKCWGMKYYVPNPYTKSIKTRTTPIVLNNYLVNWAIENENALLSEALEHAFGEKLGNLDILINALNGFSEITIKDDIITLKDKSRTNKYPDNEVWLEVDPNDKKYFFEYISNELYTGDAPKEIAAFQEHSGGMPAILAKSITTALQIDDNLKSLSSCWSSNKDGDRLYIGTLCFAVELNKALTLRDGDTNKEVVWQWNGKTYCISNEISFHRFKDFIEAYNETYAGLLKILVNKEEGKTVYVLYQLTSHIKCQIDSFIASYLTALRTKPFMLLAGISGTGKSRIVREMAFKTCPKYLQDKDGTTPGNYCMIEVKPNWHDSTELIGYYSNLSQSYQFKKFVKFLVKAQMNPEVPFFVCLDEMNLAPVEQYFAEILSILETRKHPKKNGEADMNIIKTEVIVENRYFTPSWKDKDNAVHEKIMSDADWYREFFDIEKGSTEETQIQKYQEIYTLRTEGLKLPDNVFIIGTVNMDDTTHQFSRKVIDRAMTIEMNGGRLSDMYGGSHDLEYIEDEEVQKGWQQAFLQYYVTADEVLDEHSEYAETLKEKLPARLDEINKALKGTPFEVSYRVLNELTIMVGIMLDDKKEDEDIDIDGIINQAVNNILLMKILPRIEGDSDMFAISNDFKKENGITYDNRLEWLMALAPDIEGAKPEDENEDTTSSKKEEQTARKKIKEMIDRLNNQEFTRFWP